MVKRGKGEIPPIPLFPFSPIPLLPEQSVLHLLFTIPHLPFTIHSSEVNLMPLSQELLEILACPACKAKVELKPDNSGLKCVECKRVYPIRDDIPVMLIDEATIEDEPKQE